MTTWTSWRGDCNWGMRMINENILQGLEEDSKKGCWENEMHTSRVERFEPPVWEEINDDTNWEFFFFTRDGYDYYFVVDGLMESISLRSEYGKKYYFDFTKEDYIKACTIARKLFLGESVEKGENNEESKN